MDLPEIDVVVGNGEVGGLCCSVRVRTTEARSSSSLLSLSKNDGSKVQPMDGIDRPEFSLPGGNGGNGGKMRPLLIADITAFEESSEGLVGE